LRAAVLCVGAGGLGSPALLYLAAAGVGRIGIIDFDRVDESNLQRQVLFDVDAVGQFKAQQAAKRLKSLNPTLQIDAYDEELNASVRMTVRM
ncbi:MAG TPA: ThiF family adenylyltransferase, partial [Leptospiraceae bacterium]|nr:ThiF family adenylyltransferase [Leptospiraceae bacterium]